jgi:lysozyme
MTNRKTAHDVSADLRAHEAKCEERWKTIFAETAEIKQEMNELNNTLRLAMFGVFGFMATLLIAFLTESRNNLVNISEEGISLIKKFEGCELRSYQDAVDVWTVGYGHTKDVKPGQMITKEEAEEMLIEELTEYCSYVETAVEVPLHQNQFDALVSWTYNLGPTNLNSSTMLKKLNAGEYEDIPEQIKRWNKAGGKVLPGLERRRLAESLLFEGKKWEHI